MKVLVLSETSQRSRYWESALPLLKQKGVDASFCTTRSEGEIHSQLNARNIKTLALGSKSSTDYPRAIYRLARILRQNNYDVVHASESIQAVLAGIACITSRKTKCIFHYHHTAVTGPQKLLSRLGSRLADCVMPVSKSAQNATIAHDGTPKEKTMVAYNGIDPMRKVSRSELSEIRERLGIPCKAKIICIVSKLRPEKGHRTLLEACELAASSIPYPLHLLIVGEGVERKNLEVQSASYIRFTTHFVGNQEDVAPWFAVADIVTVPSYKESFGLVALEAMSCGRLLIASNVEGLREIVEDGVNGILVEPNDPVDLADAIVTLLNSNDPSRLLESDAKQSILDNFTTEKMVDKWIQCYQKAQMAHLG
jgi:glycosyltransferase involved in cell wall biosynthesis